MFQAALCCLAAAVESYNSLCVSAPMAGYPEEWSMVPKMRPGTDGMDKGF